jgi:hypothetical protein
MMWLEFRKALRESDQITADDPAPVEAKNATILPYSAKSVEPGWLSLA